MKKRIILNLLMLFLITSCSNKQSVGTIGGGIIGGLVGSKLGKGQGNVLTTGVGVLAGALLGSEIGRHMDEQDRKILAITSQKVLEDSPSGRSVEWKNPDNGHYGYVTPTKTYQERSGRYCREYQQTIMIGGKKEEGYGKACRQPDGTWEIQ